MSRITMEATISIEVERPEELLEQLKDIYGEQNIDFDNIVEYFCHNIDARSRNHLFKLIGFETDGWGIERMNVKPLLELLKKD